MPTGYPRAKDATEKTCPRCGETKAYKLFSIDRSQADGHRPYCKTCDRKKNEEWKATHPERIKKYDALWRRRLKQEVVEAYGSKCACCGETEPWFLTIDHVNNDGKEHRLALNTKGGSHFYGWLKRQGFPQDRFQLLCYNCNCAKERAGICPHEARRRADLTPAVTC